MYTQCRDTLPSNANDEMPKSCLNDFKTTQLNLCTYTTVLWSNLFSESKEVKTPRVATKAELDVVNNAVELRPENLMRHVSPSCVRYKAEDISDRSFEREFNSSMLHQPHQ
jgi:hypothetical protein